MRRSVLSLALLAGALGLLACRGGESEAAPASGEVTGSQEGGTDATGPYLLVVNKSSNTLSVVDPATGLEVAAIETGFAPHEVAASRDGRFAYVTDYGTGPQPGSTVSVVDLGTRMVVRTLSLDPHTRPHGVAVASDGSVWVTTEGSAHVLQLNPESGDIMKAIETGQAVTHMVALAEATGRVVTANIGAGTSSILDPSTGSVVHHVETGAGAEGLDVHPDGRRAYVTNRAAGTLVEVDLATGQVLRSLEAGNFPIRAKVRPGGDELLVSNAQGNEVVAVNLESWEIVRRLPVGAAPIGILITPDNTTAYVANTQDDKVTVIDLVKWEVAGEIITGDEPDGLAWVG